MEIITNPVLPYVSPIPRTFSIGNGVRIFGAVAGGADAQMFHIRLQCGDELSTASEIAIDISVNIQDGNATINSMRSGIWDDSQHIPSIPIKLNQKFEILVKCDVSQYKMFINTRYYCGFPQRIAFDFITHLAIFGNVLVEKICYEEESLAIETPPPSYDEVQARVNASEALDADPLLQPTPGRPPYPSDPNPLFMSVAVNNGHVPESYYDPYHQHGLSHPTTSLNAASPNRPVKDTETKQLFKIVGVIVVIILVLCIAAWG